MVRATQKEYRKGYQKHFQAYLGFKKKNDHVYTRRLVLIYSVECGLKAILLSRWGSASSQVVIEQGDTEQKQLIKTHDFQSILKYLGIISMYPYKRFHVISGEYIEPSRFHEFCRYCISYPKEEYSILAENEESLLRVAEYIKEELLR